MLAVEKSRNGNGGPIPKARSALVHHETQTQTQNWTRVEFPANDGVRTPCSKAVSVHALVPSNNPPGDQQGDQES